MKMSIDKKIEKVLPFLNEKQQRIYLASEAEYLGFGGVTAISEASGISRPTIILGKKEINEKVVEFSQDRIRKKGGGRKKIYEKQPRLLKELDKLVDPVTRGDPMSPLRWTCKSTRQLSEALKKKSINISHVSIAEMLKEMGYSLQANAKVIEGGDHPDRDKQFRYINKLSKKCLSGKLPVISVDTKKKELVGNYKNAGIDWEITGQPINVNVYDFQDKTVGKAVPYGIYDIGKNEGFVNVGKSYDTSSFAVSSIRRWWIEMGMPEYKTTKQLLITADGGGSNGYRRKLWKTELQKFSNEFNLEITICHLPPGTSKWNKIEHRLFSFITMNWKGKPLTSFETIVNLIGSTTTTKGLKVKSVLDENEYEKGIIVEDNELKSVNILPHKFHGEWNYTIKPIIDS
ncbi:MAG: ISAzo13 family transposase [Bacteroidales bacterium]|nr:ISAzo13 family transposase [Bacteroidales bacterium]